MIGHISVSFSCGNFTYYKTVHVVSAGFPQCKNDVSASFFCGNYTYTKFPNRFCILKLFEIAKFQQVSVYGNWDTLEFRIAANCWLSEFQDLNNPDTICILKLHLSLSNAERIFFIQCIYEIYVIFVLFFYLICHKLQHVWCKS